MRSKDTKTTQFLNLKLTNISIQEWTKEVKNGLDNDIDNVKWFICINPHSYSISKSDAKYKAALDDADWIVPDGIGIILAAKFLGINLYQRITGLDIFYSIMNYASRNKKKVFFMGGSKQTIEKILVRVRNEFQGIADAKGISPPYSEEFDKLTNEYLLGEINNFKPDIIWIGLTAPKQEKWILDNKENLPNAFIGPIGAVFDYYAGTANLAPKFIRVIGLEWLYRFVFEPKRMWRRNLISLPAFLKDVFLSKKF